MIEIIQKKLRFPHFSIVIFNLSFSIFLASCQTFRPRQPEIQMVESENLYTYVNNTKTFTLLPPSDFQFSPDSYCHFTADFKGRTFESDCLLIINHEKIYLNLLNPLGSSLGEIVFDGKSVKSQSSVLPKSLKAEYIIADIQYIFYDFEKIAAALGKKGLRFLKTSEWIYENDGSSREILTGRMIQDGKSTISEIRYSESEVTLENKLRGYSYKIEGQFNIK